MTDDVYVYMTQLPDGVKSFCTPCHGGYTMYIDPRLDREEQRKAYFHELRHITKNDFNNHNVKSIETLNHE